MYWHKTTLKEHLNFLLKKKAYCKFTRRAGILVLVNDTDWELMDCYDYEIQDKDTIGFISTLHGG